MRFVGTRIARRLAAEGPNADIMTVLWKVTILRDPCVFCVLGTDGAGPMQLEHIRPHKRGWHNGWTNIAPACKAHNTMKADAPLWWMLWRLNEQRLGFTREQCIARQNGRPIKWMTVYTRKRRRGRLSPAAREARADAAGSVVSDGETKKEA